MAQAAAIAVISAVKLSFSKGAWKSIFETLKTQITNAAMDMI